MKEKRENNRITFVSMGIVDGQSETVSCSLENISSSGALIRTINSGSWSLQEGDIIHLKAILLSPVEFQCKVARIDDDLIAVEFLS